MVIPWPISGTEATVFSLSIMSQGVLTLQVSILVTAQFRGGILYINNLQVVDCIHLLTSLDCRYIH